MSTSRPRSFEKVSLADIAQRAGVSTNTVSRVVRGDPGVGKTRARIAETCRGTGLRAQLRGASALRGKKAHQQIPCRSCWQPPCSHGHGRVLLSIHSTSSQAGYHVSLSPPTADGRIAQHDFSLRRRRIHHRVVGTRRSTAISRQASVSQQIPRLTTKGELKRHLHRRGRQHCECAPGDRHLLARGSPTSFYPRVPSGWSDAQMQRIDCERACASTPTHQPVVLEPDSWDSR